MASNPEPHQARRPRRYGFQGKPARCARSWFGVKGQPALNRSDSCSSVKVARRSQRQNPNTFPSGFKRNHGSLRKLLAIFLKNKNQPVCAGFRAQIPCSNLNHRGTLLLDLAMNCAESEIIGKENFIPVASRLKKVRVRSIARTEVLPVGSPDTAVSQGCHPTRRQVHIDEQLQAGSSGRSASSVRQAAYARAAWISARSIYGYSSNTESSLCPDASRPSNVPTVTRVPATQGFPPITAGSERIRSNSMKGIMCKPGSFGKRLTRQGGRAQSGAEGSSSSIPGH